MRIFKDILSIWKSVNLLAQAWDDSIKMLSLSNDIFVQSIQYFNSGENIDAVKALKKEDQSVNDYYQLVRRKVLTHYSIDKPPIDTSGGLTLINMVVDIERIGDYCKNISDLTLMRDGPMNFGKLSDEIKSMEEEVESRFAKTIKAIQDQDEVLVPAVTIVATSNVVLHNNLIPKFVDVENHTYNIDPDKPMPTKL